MTFSFLNTIDNNDKAYCLGFFSYIIDTHSKYATNSYEFSNIYIDEDKDILNLCKNIVDIFNDEKTEIISMTAIDDKILEDIIVNLKNFDDWTDKMKKEFIRGLYEYNYLNNENDSENILIKKSTYLNDILPKIGGYLNIPYIFTKLENDDKTEYLTYSYGCSTCDFLGTIYNEIDSNSYSFKAANYNLTIPKCCFIRVDNNAVVPSKENWSDVGYDLSIINKIKDFNSKTSLYDTGIKIQLDYGYYAEIVPRSSISKSGYILSNNIGIIDNSYRGNLMIALTKIADDAIEITYPFKCCQLIIKKQVYVHLEEVKDLDNTKRSEGGFGSTDK
jgi:deoxyuridine 5'-triphosphate nucleotidohydrolase